MLVNIQRKATGTWAKSRRFIIGTAISIGASIYAVAILATAWTLWRQRAALRPATNEELWLAVTALGTVASAFAAIAVAAFALRGLRSLRLTRADMVNRSEREGKLAAIQRLEELATEIIAMNTPILDSMVAGKVAPYISKADEIRFNPDPTDLRAARDWVRSLPIELHNQIRNFLNRLEAWCVYFTTGVADEAVAFDPVAPLLRSWVAQYYPVLLLVRSERSSGNFPNIVMLYTAWTNKMDDEQLSTLFRDVTAQLDRRRSVMAKGPQLPIPIGSKIDD